MGQYIEKDWEIWDSISITATGSFLNGEFFANQKGQGTSVFASSGSKIIADTNLISAGMLQSGELMKVFQVGVIVSGNTDNYRGALASNLCKLMPAVLTVTMGNNYKVFQQPLWALPAGGGMLTRATNGTPTVGSGGTTPDVNEIQAPAASTDPVTYALNGAPLVDAMYTLKYPIELHSQERFSVELDLGVTSPAMTTGATILTVVFKGTMMKSVMG